jgi:hypothetical protein
MELHHPYIACTLSHPLLKSIKLVSNDEEGERQFLQATNEVATRGTDPSGGLAVIIGYAMMHDKSWLLASTGSMTSRSLE